jgi:hypothetical protein
LSRSISRLIAIIDSPARGAISATGGRSRLIADLGRGMRSARVADADADDPNCGLQRAVSAIAKAQTA